ncbi:MAG: hypothetical protein ACREOE_07645 [Gemmatimonadales bacterium]
MNLKKKILMSVAAVALPLGSATFVVGTAGVASATPSVGTDTVTCNSFIGTISISPGLVAGGTLPAKIGVKGTLMGCTDGFAIVAAGGAFSASVKGTLYSRNNDLLGLQGANPLTCKHGDNWKAPKPVVHCGDISGSNPYGSLVVTWSSQVAAAGGTGFTTATPYCTYGAQFGLTTLTDGAGNSPYAGVTGAGNYGAFVLGAPAHSFLDTNSLSCGQSALYTADGQEDQSASLGAGAFTGDFSGTDTGASSATSAMTANDAAALLNGQEAKGSKSVITLGSSAVYFG